MFSRETYVSRRSELKRLVGNGIIVLFGNNESPANYPSNGYYPFRQDSSFLYYFGLNREGLVGVIDIDNDRETLIGNDIDIEDIVWFGSVDSVSDMAASTGVVNTAPMATLAEICNKAREKGQKIHFLPPYRFDTKIQIHDLLGIHPSLQKEAASAELIKAVVKMRSVKEQQEIDEIERACAIGYKMHTTAMRLTRPGVTEKFVGGQVDGTANSYGAMVSFPTIFTQHGEIMHGNPSMSVLEDGRLALCDAGAETINNYCSDNTRTYPVNGKFTQRQLEIYSIVEACHDYVLGVAKPGVRWFDVHMAVCRLMTERLKDTGLMKGDTEEAVRAGAHAMFLPHGLGHMMGMDVHDMEGLGQDFVGFDEETRPSTQFGTNCLRMGRRLEEGFVLTDEPGIYFIPALIDDWKARGLHRDFINYDMLETYKDFGGIRIEDDILITADGCRFLGKERIPYHPADVENFMRNN
ncbi:aminopeptidase P family protein [Prevotella sp. PCHR]|uniref:Xaa-Pro aminopeptidase n=1 Tax=Xylanibacter caecicola TaxID=2736294 RepID=A0ABX2B2L5_9BACT|nr:aminopeptidase P family protein [Xylanibacter caecicola]NPE24940.1 aminopeptidase P family protein [Xylanibacter caecicola]